MVVKGATKYVIQQLAQKFGPRFQTYVRQEYGQVAGSIVGGAIGIAAGGDFYGAFNKGIGGNKPPYDRTPPFGYLDGSEPINGSTTGSFPEALRSTSYQRYKYRRNRVKCPRGCRRKYNRKQRNRSRRR